MYTGGKSKTSKENAAHSSDVFIITLFEMQEQEPNIPSRSQLFSLNKEDDKKVKGVPKVLVLKNSPGSPSPRFGASATPLGSSCVLFGGLDPKLGKPTDEILKFSFDALSWTWLARLYWKQNFNF